MDLEPGQQRYIIRARQPTATSTPQLTPAVRLSCSRPEVDAKDLAILIRSTVDRNALGALAHGGADDQIAIDNLASSMVNFIISLDTRVRIGDQEPAEQSLEGDMESVVIRNKGLPPCEGKAAELQYARGETEEPITGGYLGSMLRAATVERRGRIVANAVFRHRPAAWAEQQTGGYSPRSIWPEGTNIELIEEFQRRLKELGVRLMRGKEHFCESELLCKPTLIIETDALSHKVLEQIAVLPSHADQDCVSSLLGWIHPYADAMRLPVFLVISEASRRAYEDLGYEPFEDGGDLRLSLSGFGGEGEYVHLAMVRVPVWYAQH